MRPWFRASVTHLCVAGNDVHTGMLPGNKWSLNKVHKGYFFIHRPAASILNGTAGPTVVPKALREVRARLYGGPAHSSLPRGDSASSKRPEAGPWKGNNQKGHFQSTAPGSENMHLPPEVRACSAPATGMVSADQTHLR